MDRRRASLGWGLMLAGFASDCGGDDGAAAGSSGGDASTQGASAGTETGATAVGSSDVSEGSPTGDAFVGGWFWWYFLEDMVPRDRPLWTVLDQALAP